MRHPAKRSRKWYQFSLRSYVVLMLVTGVAIAQFGLKLKRARRQQRAADQIIQMGGIVTYNGDPDVNTQGSRSQLRKILGDDFFDDVVEVHLSGPQIQDLSMLRDLTGLELLDLSATNVCDLSVLQELRQLEVLRLDDNPQVVDLSPLAGLERLRELDLLNTYVIDGQLEHLKKALPGCIVTQSSPVPGW